MSYLFDGLTLLSLMLVKPLILLLFILTGAGFYQKHSASTQHFIYVLGLFALLVLPVASFISPAIEFPLYTISVFSAPSSSMLEQIALSVEASTSVSLALSLSAVYLLIMFWCFFYIWSGVLKLFIQTRIYLKSNDIESDNIVQRVSALFNIHRKVSIIVSPHNCSPQVWGVFRPVIIVPPQFSDWSSQRKTSVLTHELAHVCRHDWLAIMLARTACAVFWYLPPVWMCLKKINYLAELACDDCVVKSINKENYAEDLLAIYKHIFAAGKTSTAEGMGAAFIYKSQFFQRITALLDGSLSRTSLSNTYKCVVGLTVCSLLIPFSALQASVIARPLVDDRRTDDFLPMLNTYPVNPPENISEKKLPELPSQDELQQLKASLFNLNEAEPRSVQQQTLTHALLKEETVTGSAAEVLYREELTSVRVAVDPGQASQVINNSAVHLINYQPYTQLNRVVPVYPYRALKRGIEGEVRVRFTVSASGSVKDPKVIHSRPKKMFDRAVLSALKDYRFKPLIMAGEAQSVRNVEEDFIFRIQSKTTVFNEQ